jgi:hypothetical protein
VDAELAVVVDEAPPHDRSRPHVDPGPMVQADLDPVDQPAAARGDRTGLSWVAELLHHEVPDLHAGAARDAAAGDRELELPRVLRSLCRADKPSWMRCCSSWIAVVCTAGS